MKTFLLYLLGTNLLMDRITAVIFEEGVENEREYSIEESRDLQSDHYFFTTLPKLDFTQPPESTTSESSPLNPPSEVDLTPSIASQLPTPVLPAGGKPNAFVFPTGAPLPDQGDTFHFPSVAPKVATTIPTAGSHIEPSPSGGPSSTLFHFPTVGPSEESTTLFYFPTRGPGFNPNDSGVDTTTPPMPAGHASGAFSFPTVSPMIDVGQTKAPSSSALFSFPTTSPSSETDEVNEEGVGSETIDLEGDTDCNGSDSMSPPSVPVLGPSLVLEAGTRNPIVTSSFPSASPGQQLHSVSDTPEVGPINSPTDFPFVAPSPRPTLFVEPLGEPTSRPSLDVLAAIQDILGITPSAAPTMTPTDSPAPSLSPSTQPTATPSDLPTTWPTETPNKDSTETPTALNYISVQEELGIEPSAFPSSPPSAFPSSSPSISPIGKPSEVPSQEPTALDFISVQDQLGIEPSSSPSATPSEAPRHYTPSYWGISGLNTGSMPSITPTIVPSSTSIGNKGEGQGTEISKPGPPPSSNTFKFPTISPTVPSTISQGLIPTTINPTMSSYGAQPTEGPTSEPTLEPTVEPTFLESTRGPGSESTPGPTIEIPAGAQPTEGPTSEPTVKPTLEPTELSTVFESTTGAASESTPGPTSESTTEPTTKSTPGPTIEPTTEPTLVPTIEPTLDSTSPQSSSQSPSTIAPLRPSSMPSIRPSEEPFVVESEEVVYYFPTKNSSPAPSTTAASSLVESDEDIYFAQTKQPSPFPSAFSQVLTAAPSGVPASESSMEPPEESFVIDSENVQSEPPSLSPFDIASSKVPSTAPSQVLTSEPSQVAKLPHTVLDILCEVSNMFCSSNYPESQP